MATTSDIGSVVFSEPKTSGKFKKICISNSNGKKILIETEECFSWGVQKSDRYVSYSLPLVFKNGDQTVKVLKEILSKCKGRTSESVCMKSPAEKRQQFTRSLGTTLVSSVRASTRETPRLLL